MPTNKPNLTKVIYIGRHGEKAPTHCYVTKKPLLANPVNYAIGDNKYISINKTERITTEALNKIKVTPPKPKAKKKETN